MCVDDDGPALLVVTDIVGSSQVNKQIALNTRLSLSDSMCNGREFFFPNGELRLYSSPESSSVGSIEQRPID